MSPGNRARICCAPSGRAPAGTARRRQRSFSPNTLTRAATAIAPMTIPAIAPPERLIWGGTQTFPPKFHKSGIEKGRADERPATGPVERDAVWAGGQQGGSSCRHPSRAPQHAVIATTKAFKGWTAAWTVPPNPSAASMMSAATPARAAARALADAGAAAAWPCRSRPRRRLGCAAAAAVLHVACCMAWLPSSALLSATAEGNVKGVGGGAAACCELSSWGMAASSHTSLTATFIREKVWTAVWGQVVGGGGSLSCRCCWPRGPP